VLIRDLVENFIDNATEQIVDSDKGMQKKQQIQFKPKELLSLQLELEEERR